VLLTHQGARDPVRAVAFAVWATYPALALFGLRNLRQKNRLRHVPKCNMMHII
jgi:hypothetical protein